jgi:hypothetical protein
MSGAFADYRWGDAFEMMHTTLRNTRHHQADPKYVCDQQLMEMWETAYESYMYLIQSWSTLEKQKKATEDQLAAAREADDFELIESLIAQLSRYDLTDKEEEASELRLYEKSLLLNEIEDEIIRRPWLCADKTESVDAELDFINK